MPVTPGASRYRPGRVVGLGLGAGIVLLMVGVVAGRPDVAVLGVAPVLAAARDLQRRPRGGLVGRCETMPAPREDPGRLAARVHLDVPPEVQTVHLRVLLPGAARREALVHAGGRDRSVQVTSACVRTGPQELFTVEHRGIGAGDVSVADVATVAPGRVVILPRGRRIARAPLPSRLRGLAGAHESRLAGDGGSLRDVHPFASGDTLRRVDWRTTARRSPTLAELYVRRTYALAEAVVTLVVDSRDDVGPDPATWSGSAIRSGDMTSLDIAREAAASVAQHYVGAGDRIALEDLGVRRRPLRPGAGRRHLDRVVHQLASMRPEGEPVTRVRAPQVTAGSLIYVFSTFLDPQAALLAGQWRRSGHRVVAVDVLPTLRPSGLRSHQRLAMRILRIERDDRLAEMTASGVELVTWARDRPGAVDLALATLAVRGRRHHGTGRAG